MVSTDVHVPRPSSLDGTRFRASLACVEYDFYRIKRTHVGLFVMRLKALACQRMEKGDQLKREILVLSSCHNAWGTTLAELNMWDVAGADFGRRRKCSKCNNPRAEDEGATRNWGLLRRRLHTWRCLVTLTSTMFVQVG
ncbi:hypothetical protein BST61_g4027 [Cercospora zeina]